MAKKKIFQATSIAIGDGRAVDIRLNPWPSKDNFLIEVDKLTLSHGIENPRQKGMSIPIEEDGSIVEYWFIGGTTNGHFVRKHETHQILNIDRIISGGDITLTDSQATVAAISFTIAGTIYNKALSNYVIPDADILNNRIDRIVSNGTTITYLQGIPGKKCTPPKIPTSSISLGIIFVSPDLAPVAETGGTSANGVFSGFVDGDNGESYAELPQVKNVNISGILELAETLTGTYVYEDIYNIPEGASTYQWKRGSTIIGTALTYVVTIADLGQTLSFGVKPSNQENIVALSYTETTATINLYIPKLAITTSNIAGLTGSFRYHNTANPVGVSFGIGNFSFPTSFSKTILEYQDFNNNGDFLIDFGLVVPTNFKATIKIYNANGFVSQTIVQLDSDSITYLTLTQIENGIKISFELIRKFTFINNSDVPFVFDFNAPNFGSEFDLIFTVPAGQTLVKTIEEVATFASTEVTIQVPDPYRIRIRQFNNLGVDIGPFANLEYNGSAWAPISITGASVLSYGSIFIQENLYTPVIRLENNTGVSQNLDYVAILNSNGSESSGSWGFGPGVTEWSWSNFLVSGPGLALANDKNVTKIKTNLLENIRVYVDIKNNKGQIINNYNLSFLGQPHEILTANTPYGITFRFESLAIVGTNTVTNTKIGNFIFDRLVHKYNSTTFELEVILTQNKLVASGETISISNSEYYWPYYVFNQLSIYDCVRIRAFNKSTGIEVRNKQDEGFPRDICINGGRITGNVPSTSNQVFDGNVNSQRSYIFNGGDINYETHNYTIQKVWFPGYMIDTSGIAVGSYVRVVFVIDATNNTNVHSASYSTGFIPVIERNYFHDLSTEGPGFVDNVTNVRIKVEVGKKLEKWVNDVLIQTYTSADNVTDQTGLVSIYFQIDWLVCTIFKYLNV